MGLFNGGNVNNYHGLLRLKSKWLANGCSSSDCSPIQIWEGHCLSMVLIHTATVVSKRHLCTVAGDPSGSPLRCLQSLSNQIIYHYMDRERERKRERETTCRRIANYSRVIVTKDDPESCHRNGKKPSLPALLCCQRCFKSSILNSLLSSCSFLAQLR